MDFNIEIRRKQLENLDQFMGSSRDRVDSILEYLGWSAQKITENQKEMVKCMVNPSSHRIPAATAVTHVQNCAWRKENYAADDLPLSEPNPVPGSTIIIDDMTKINVLNSALAKNPLMKTGWRSHEPVPKTSNRLLATFTPDERLALYEYSVAATRGPPEVPEFNMTKPKIEERHNLTADELKAIHRDARRRRIKYKSKCVHTNRKSTTEVLRDVIESQMEQYEDYVRDEQDGGSIAGLTECSERSFNSGGGGSGDRREDDEYEARSYSREKRGGDYEARSYSREKRGGDYEERSYSREKRGGDYEERSYSREKRDEYDDKSYKRKDDDRGYSKREDDRGYSKREDKGYSRKEDDKGYSKREDQSYTKQEDKSNSKREDKGYSKREDPSCTSREDKSNNKRDDKGYGKREEDKSKREEKSYSKREEDQGYSKREDKDYTKQEDKGYGKREEDKSNSKEDKAYNKKENHNDKDSNKPEINKDTSSTKPETEVDNKSATKDEPNTESTRDTNKPAADNHTNTLKVHTKGYLKEYSTELRNNFPQPEQQQPQMVNNKKHQSLVDAELEHESNETASPRSSRSQNSYRSQESRHRGRPRTPTEPSYRDRSRSRDRRHRYQRSRRHDERKYRDRRHYDRQRSDR